jgi:hypothetical protein
MLTAFGAAAVTFMMLMYALEHRGRSFAAGTWPFGLVELIWAGIAFNRYRNLATIRG